MLDSNCHSSLICISNFLWIGSWLGWASYVASTLATCHINAINTKKILCLLHPRHYPPNLFFFLLSLFYFLLIFEITPHIYFPISGPPNLNLLVAAQFIPIFNPGKSLSNMRAQRKIISKYVWIFKFLKFGWKM